MNTFELMRLRETYQRIFFSRCVDEINQGMDPINERKMFELLVKVTTECDNTQYFLLTPKVSPNKITFHHQLTSLFPN